MRFFSSAAYSPTKDFKLNSEFTYERADVKYSSPSYSPGFMNPATLVYTPYNPGQSSFMQGVSQKDYLGLNLYGSYGRSFNSHSLKVLAGYNQESSKTRGFSASRQELITYSVPGLSTATGTPSVSDNYTDFGIVGFFGRLNYSFKEKYLLELNGRYDGSSRFPTGSRFGFFPSMSAAWRVINESFMAGLNNTVTELKLRGSYGEIGNQNIANYAALPTMNAFNADWINPNTGTRAVSLQSPDLVSGSFTWERVRTLNVGVDVGLFKNRLYTVFDYYDRKTLGMLAQGSELPGILGASAPLQNVADLSTKGWELNVVWKDAINKLHYSLGFNLYDNATTITRFKNDGGLLSQNYEGKNMNELWGYQTAGYYTVSDFQEATLNANLTGGKLKEGVASFKGINQNPGDTKYADLNGDGVIFSGNNTLADPGDQRIIGNTNRRFQYGFNGSIEYAGFDLSVFLQGVGKRQFWSNNPVVFPYTFEFTTVYKHQLDYWTPQNTDAFYPRNYPNGSGNYGGNIRTQTKYLQNGAYMRLKNITLGYTLPQNILGKLKINTFRVFLTGENLLNFDHLPDGMDPELSTINNGGNYPFLKNVSCGLNLTF
jgi:TonB-linked SusC/RagA family outer membrane protein